MFDNDIITAKVKNYTRIRALNKNEQAKLELLRLSD
jgi:hypothetical protein